MASGLFGRYAGRVVDQSTTGRQALAIRFRELQRDPIRRRAELLAAGVHYSRSLVQDDPLLALEVADWTLGLVRAPAAPEDARDAVALAALALGAAREVADQDVVSELVDRCLSLVPDPAPYGTDPVDWILIAADADRQGGRSAMCFERLEEALEHGGGPGRSGRLSAIMTSAVHALSTAPGPGPFISQVERALAEARRAPVDRRLANLVLAVLAQARLAEADVPSAGLFARQIEEATPQHLPAVVAMVAARVALAANDPKEAIRWLELSTVDIQVDDATELGRLHAHARAAVELNDPEARRLVSDLIRIASANRGPEAETRLADAKALLAEVQHRMGNGDEAYRTLRSARDLESGRVSADANRSDGEVDLRDMTRRVSVRSIMGVDDGGSMLVSLVDAPGRYSTAGRLEAFAGALRLVPGMQDRQLFVEVVDAPSRSWELSILDVLAEAQIPADRLVLHLGAEVVADLSAGGRHALARLRERGSWLSTEPSVGALRVFLDGDGLGVDLCMVRLDTASSSAESDVVDGVRALMVSLGVQLLVDGVDDELALGAARRMGAHGIRGTVASPVLSVSELAGRRSAIRP